MIYELNFRQRANAGAVVPGRLLSGGLDRLKLAGRVTFLCHGFNVNQSDGRKRLGLLAKKLDTGREDIVTVLWPGDAPGGFVLGAATYQFQGQDADATARRLAEFIDDTFARGTTFSFVSHSLGARVVMETVKALSGKGFRIDQVCLMAAAIDDYSVANPEDYKPAVKSACRVAVLSSKKDKVLKYAYPVGDLLQSFIYFWKDSAGLALGYHGPRQDPDSGSGIPANVSHEPIANKEKVGHGDYISELDPVQISTSNPQQSETMRKTHAAAGFVKAVLSGDPEPRYL